MTRDDDVSVERNLDSATVEGFGEEWAYYDQSRLTNEERSEIFRGYFSIFPWDTLAADAEGFDLGCGSGRWAAQVAPRVGILHCIDASRKALAVAEENLASVPNCRFHLASVDEIPLADASMDFGYSLGVLHHVPETEHGIRACTAKLKPGAPFLLYLYYAFDNRPGWFRLLWNASDLIRKVISTLPVPVRIAATKFLATTVYWPLARMSAVLERIGYNVATIPLSFYRHRSYYTMCTDALDRFGTRLERRFSREEIAGMMTQAGLTDIRFSETEPHWCAVGYRGEADPE